MALVFGVESSCDETSVGIVRDGSVLANIVASQIVHQAFGGVVPELAARDHMKNMVSIAEKALHTANIELKEVDLFACTQEPGLIGCLIVGSQFTKSLALSLNKPFYSINHLHAHVVSPAINHSELRPPYLCLLASGGHTQIVICHRWDEIEILGQTLDDAAGEAFDKSARLLGFSYAGGQMIDKNAQMGNHQRFSLPIPRMNDYNYSFSGLKTAIRYLIENEVRKNAQFVTEHLHDLCASIQYAIVETLVRPLFDVAEKYKCTTITIAGGVAANSYFRKRILETCASRKYKCFFPNIEFCTDNGAMVAFLAEKLLKQGKKNTPYSSACKARI